MDGASLRVGREVAVKLTAANASSPIRRGMDIRRAEIGMLTYVE